MKLFELLQLVIGKLNNAVSTDVQNLSDEQKAQAKANLGISETSEATISDWDQNDVNAPDYVKNRTHYKEKCTGDKNLVGFDSLSDVIAIEAYEEDGETKYRWTQQEYLLTCSKNILGPEESWLGNPREVVLCIRDYSGYREEFLTATFTTGRGDGEYEWRAKVETDTFILQERDNYLGDGMYGPTKWYFCPKGAPSSDIINSVVNTTVTEEPTSQYIIDYIGIYNLGFRYSTLDEGYLPSSVATHSQVSNSIHEALSNIDYETLNNRPFYHIPLSYETIYHPKYQKAWEGYIEGTSPLSLSPKDWIGGIIRPDNTYRVYFMGAWYTCTCWCDESEEVCSSWHWFLGNGSLYNTEFPDTDEPFCVRINTENERETTLYFAEGTSYQGPEGYSGKGKFFIDYVTLEQLVTLDEKFIPDEIARVSDIPGACITDSELTTLADLLGVTLEGETNTTQE